MMSIENYKKALESMSREELLNEISNLISDHGIQLQDKCNEIQELKSSLARADLQLQFQIGEVDLRDKEIERLKGKRESEDKSVVEYSPFLMCENYDLYLRSMSKEELIEYFYFVTDNYRNLSDKSALENIELQKQVEQLLDQCVTINKDYLQECEEHLKTMQVVKELQKQVDELKVEMHKIESAENETYMLGFEDGEKKATKEICDEILRKLETDWTDAVKAVKETAKNKGIEVE